MDEVKSNMTPRQVHYALMETFRLWVDFSMGVGTLGGRMLKAPSGQMAAALRAEYDRKGNVVALYVDSKELGAIESKMIQGHKGFSLKRRMLYGNAKAKRSEAGYLYRFIPIADNPTFPTKPSSIKSLFTTRDMPQGGVIRINRNLAAMWISNKQKSHSGSTNIRTMSSKPGSARWYIPAMPAFNIEKLLTDALPKNLKARVMTKF